MAHTQTTLFKYRKDYLRFKIQTDKPYPYRFSRLNRIESVFFSNENPPNVYCNIISEV